MHWTCVQGAETQNDCLIEEADAIIVLQISSNMRQSKNPQTSPALQEALICRATAQDDLFRVMQVRRNLQ